MLQWHSRTVGKRRVNQEAATDPITLYYCFFDDPPTSLGCDSRRARQNKTDDKALLRLGLWGERGPTQHAVNTSIYARRLHPCRLRFRRLTPTTSSSVV
jgi:hypothetical protein